MNVYHTVGEVKIENGLITMKVDGQCISKALNEISSVFILANDIAINHYELSPSGYGIYWPLLDEDISIDGLLGIKHSPPQWKKIA